MLIEHGLIHTLRATGAALDDKVRVAIKEAADLVEVGTLVIELSGTGTGAVNVGALSHLDVVVKLGSTRHPPWRRARRRPGFFRRWGRPLGSSCNR